MIRVFVADAKPEERSGLRLLLLDLKMEVAGKAAATGHYSHQPSGRLNAYLNACSSRQ